jgi:hypothetical protein
MSGTDSRPIAVVGGVYRECCRFPFYSDEIWGSGGRAAAVLSALGSSTTLYTAADQTVEQHLRSVACSHGFSINVARTSRCYQFHYEHGLAVPTVFPHMRDDDSKVQIRVTSPIALVFGMLEADPGVNAEVVVYDPQTPLSPSPFVPAPGSYPRIAYVLNAAEACCLSGECEPEIAGSKLMSIIQPEVVIVKLGVKGALVFYNGRCTRISACITPRVWKIGSGDVYSAVFTYKWAIEGHSPEGAAHLASRGAAWYVNNRGVLPIPTECLISSYASRFVEHVLNDSPLLQDEYHVYLAGPFFNTSQRWLIEEARHALQQMGLRVFSPLHDVGFGSAHDVAPRDIEALKSSRAVIALLDGLDTGTVFEIGYARALSKPVVVLIESSSEEPVKMISGTGCVMVDDFVSAIYRVAWAALT